MLNFDHTEISITANESDFILLHMEQKLKEGEAKYCLQQFTKEHSSHTLTLSAEPEKSKIWGSHCSVERKFFIQLGKGSVKNLFIKHAHGAMSFDSGSYGEFTLNASHTAVELANINAQKAKLELHHGSLDLAQATGQKMAGKWRHGKVSIEQSQFKQVEFEKSHAKIELVTHKGQMIAVKGRHSGIRVNTTDSERVALSNKHGPIYFKGDAKFVKVDNSHGLINTNFFSKV